MSKASDQLSAAATPKKKVRAKKSVFQSNEFTYRGNSDVYNEGFIGRILIALRLKKSKKAKFEAALAHLTSKVKHREVNNVACHEFIKNEHSQKKTYYSYESTLLNDSGVVDLACTEYHILPLEPLFGEAQYLKTLLHSSLHTELAQASPSEIASKIKLSIIKQQNRADELVKNYKEAKERLDVFKLEHRRTTEALYSAKKQKIMPWILFVMISFETIVNGIFLNTGFALTVAFMISCAAACINILGNAFLGEKYRIKNHVQPEEAKKGKWCLILAILLTLSINCLVGWYRLQTAAPASADENLLTGILFFVLGIGFGVAAFYEKYISDDPYPKYGFYSRIVAECLGEISEMRGEHVEGCANLKQDADLKLDDLDDEVVSTFKRVSMYLPEMARKVTVWEEDRGRINSVYRQLQTIFKSVICANISSRADGVYETTEDLPEDVRLTHCRLTIKELTEGMKNDSKKQMEVLRKSISDQKEELEKWWQSSIAEELRDFPRRAETLEAIKLPSAKT